MAKVADSDEKLPIGPQKLPIRMKSCRLARQKLPIRAKSCRLAPQKLPIRMKWSTMAT
jgi:hypothetical protein